MGTSLSFASVFDACNHAKSTRNPVLFASSKSIRKPAKVQFAVFSNPVAGDPQNHNPRILTASDGKGYDYQIGLAVTVPGRETGGPRQTVATFKDRWAKAVRVGCFSPSYQTYFTGDIAEILVYTRPLTAPETNRVRIYLMSKWNL